MTHTYSQRRRSFPQTPSRIGIAGSSSPKHYRNQAGIRRQASTFVNYSAIPENKNGPKGQWQISMSEKSLKHLKKKKIIKKKMPMVWKKKPLHHFQEMFWFSHGNIKWITSYKVIYFLCIMDKPVYTSWSLFSIVSKAKLCTVIFWQIWSCFDIWQPKSIS